MDFLSGGDPDTEKTPEAATVPDTPDGASGGMASTLVFGGFGRPLVPAQGAAVAGAGPSGERRGVKRSLSMALEAAEGDVPPAEKEEEIFVSDEDGKEDGNNTIDITSDDEGANP